jgi:hypothetical protein
MTMTYSTPYGHLTCGSMECNKYVCNKGHKRAVITELWQIITRMEGVIRMFSVILCYNISRGQLPVQLTEVRAVYLTC